MNRAFGDGTLRFGGALDSFQIVPRRSSSATEIANVVPAPLALLKLAAYAETPSGLARIQSFLEGQSLYLSRGLRGAEVIARYGELLRSGQLVVVRIPSRRVVVPVEQQVEPLGPESQPEEREDLTWIAFEVKDEEGQPLKGQKFRLTLPDGSTRDDVLDDEGNARLNRIPPGACKFTLLDVDGSEWKAA